MSTPHCTRVEEAPSDEGPGRLWRGLLVGSAVSLSAFWGPVSLVVWWWLHR